MVEKLLLSDNLRVLHQDRRRGVYRRLDRPHGHLLPDRGRHLPDHTVAAAAVVVVGVADLDLTPLRLDRDRDRDRDPRHLHPLIALENVIRGSINRITTRVVVEALESRGVLVGAVAEIGGR